MSYLCFLWSWLKINTQTVTPPNFFLLFLCPKVIFMAWGLLSGGPPISLSVYSIQPDRHAKSPQMLLCCGTKEAQLLCCYSNVLEQHHHPAYSLGSRRLLRPGSVSKSGISVLVEPSLCCFCYF